jgi:hypothetical protein
MLCRHRVQSSDQQLSLVLLDLQGATPRCMQALRVLNLIRPMTAAMLLPAAQPMLWRQPVAAVPQMISLRDIGRCTSSSHDVHARNMQLVSCSSSRWISASSAVLRQDPVQQQQQPEAAVQQVRDVSQC